MNQPNPSSPASRAIIALLVVIALLAGAIVYLLAFRSDVPAPIAFEAHESGQPPPPASIPRRPAPPMPAGIDSPRPAMQSVTPDQQRDALSSYEAVFRADVPDPKWAASAEKSLIEAATDPAIEALSTPRDFKAECAGRMCKVHMQFETLMQANDWAELYVVGISDAISLARISVVPNPNGGADLIVYGAREGSEELLTSPPAR